MIEKYDLHSHSRKSDGELAPAELVRRARQQGVTTLALTDHDSIAGLTEARMAADEEIRLVNGIELSTSWQNQNFHVVGLNINPDNAPLIEATRELEITRQQRAETIAAKLEKKRIPGALEWVTQKASGSMITRTHFADFLVAHHHVDSQQEAFDRYLARGKPAYAATAWMELKAAIGLITQAGGIAVLAHPMRYNLTAKWMKRLLTAFQHAGGQAIEVVTGRSSAEEISLLGEYARAFELAGSVGSDFHRPENQWVELGRLAPLPPSVRPVWDLFN